jgi:hypothetical protein
LHHPETYPVNSAGAKAIVSAIDQLQSSLGDINDLLTRMKRQKERNQKKKAEETAEEVERRWQDMLKDFNRIQPERTLDSLQEELRSLKAN